MEDDVAADIEDDDGMDDDVAADMADYMAADVADECCIHSPFVKGHFRTRAIFKPIKASAHQIGPNFQHFY